MGRAYQLPQFPSVCKVWRGSLTDYYLVVHNTGSPALTGQKCEVVARWAQNLNVSFNTPANNNLAPQLLVIYFPKGTDIRGMMDTTTYCDTVEVPSGSGRFYIVTDTFPVALDFENEFLAAAIIPGELPTPF
jgi:hypothetical protein